MLHKFESEIFYKNDLPLLRLLYYCFCTYALKRILLPVGRNSLHIIIIIIAHHRKQRTVYPPPPPPYIGIYRVKLSIL